MGLVGLISKKHYKRLASSRFKIYKLYLNKVSS